MVWKPREGVDDNSIEQWLTQIRLRVSDARVILVSTYCNDSRPDLDYGHLKERFGSILEGSFEVDNSDGTGIPELLEAITSLAARLPQVGSMISRRWLAARHDLLALQAAEISRAAFDDICEQHRMTEREGQTLLELLHDLGAIIYYGNDEGLRDVIVLQPEWLTKAISYVLLDRQTLNSNGELEHSRLLQIWKDHGDPTRESYPERYHPYFLRLMEKFDISYRLQDEPRSLVGQMVPTQKPQLPWESSSELNRGDRELALKCSMSDVPPGLAAWLTVRNHRFSTQRHWKRGVFLAHQSCEGLLELCGQLSITVRGPSPDYFFSLLRDSLEYLVEQRWPGLVYEFQVPCRHYNKERKRCEGAFKFSSLLAARLRGIVKIQCHDCFSECDVGELLTGFATAKEPVEQKLDEILRIQKRSAAFQRQTATTQNQAAAEIRKMLTMLSAENRDCPHLFWLARSDRAGWKRLFSTEYLLQLYCEEPEKQHPVDAVYTISRSDDWLLRIAPYASLVIKILKVAAPLAAPLVEMTASASVADTEKPRLDLMEKVIGDFADQIGHDSTITVGDTGLTALQGSGLRAFHALLLAVDPQRKWGDLRRVQSASKDFLWVCPYHYKQYDPGLPILLYRRT